MLMYEQVTLVCKIRGDGNPNAFQRQIQYSTLSHRLA